ncbi:MAG: TIGR03621 family F420-dependent LLM class oxidoreductase [Chloroflexia bacterium]
MARPFRFGAVTSGLGSPEAWVGLARRAEELGYSTLLMPDRPSMGGMAPIAALTAAAMTTTRLRVGSYVFSNDYRHPAMLAKEAATLDLLSGGRFELGLGAGVGQPDYRQMGLSFDEAGTRVGRFEEALRIIKLMFTEDEVSFSGKYYTIEGMRGLPKPEQKPHPPIVMGSSGKRMLTIAGREADIIAPTPKFPRPGQPADDVPLEEKIGWIREAAGERFADIELAQTAYYIELTDAPTPIATQPSGPPIPKRPMSTDQTVEHLEELRERYGFSYIQIFEAQLENFAPVIERLVGR